MDRYKQRKIEDTFEFVEDILKHCFKIVGFLIIIASIITLFALMVITIITDLKAEASDNDTWISKTAQEACILYGEEYGICPELLMAIIETESNGNPMAENGGCIGLMQISEKWHQKRMEQLQVVSLTDEYGNILVGTDYLAELFQEYGEVSTVLMVYHGEKNAVEKSEQGQISAYAKKILERSAELERIHGK